MPTAIDTTIFKSYDVRGTVPAQLNDDVAYAIGRAYVEVLDRKNICIGRDMRPSGEGFLAALSRGATDAGANVTYVGLISTDALYFAVGHYGFDGGIMITASHNPAHYNGFKFCREEAIAISIETGLGDIRDLAMSGNFRPLGVPGTLAERDILEDFALHCMSFIDDVANLRPLKIAIDAGNGMAGATVPRVFAHLPFEVVPLYFELDGTFPNHPASPIEPENMVDLQRAVLEHGCDLGVAFDGDADRMFIVDERGALIGGDIVTALVGVDTLAHVPGAKILYNLICSRSVPEAIKRAGGVPVRSKVGHSFIKKVMRDEDIPFGGEHSGHFYFKRNWFADSGMIALMQCLNVFSRASETVSGVIAPIDTRSRSGEINSTVGDIPATVAALETHFRAQGAAIDHLDGSTISFADRWLNIRASNTEPLLRLNVEGDSPDRMVALRDEALAIIRG